MKCCARIALIFAPLSCCLAAAEDTSGWKEESNSKGVAIHSRARAGSELREFRGVGMIEAPPAVAFAVLDDLAAYTSFMPYTTECRVIQRQKDAVIIYQRLKLPLISDRDYTIRSRYDQSHAGGSAVYRIHWETANDLGPAPNRGVVRVNRCEGGWLLEPHGTGATRATYTIHSDSGGAIPAMLANNGSRMAIRKLFEAVRKQVKLPKYATSAE